MGSNRNTVSCLTCLLQNSFIFFTSNRSHVHYSICVRVCVWVCVCFCGEKRGLRRSIQWHITDCATAVLQPSPSHDQISTLKAPACYCVDATQGFAGPCLHGIAASCYLRGQKYVKWKSRALFFHVYAVAGPLAVLHFFVLNSTVVVSSSIQPKLSANQHVIYMPPACWRTVCKHVFGEINNPAII